MNEISRDLNVRWVSGGYPILHTDVAKSENLFQIHARALCLLLFLFNTLRPRRNGRAFADDIFKCIFLNENVRIPIEISLKFVPKGPINNIPSLVQIMAWRRQGDKPLSEPMIVSLLMHICVTRAQWVKCINILRVNDKPPQLWISVIHLWSSLVIYGTP